VAPSLAHIDAMSAKAKAALLRQDGVEALSARFIDFKGEPVLIKRSDGVTVVHYRERYAGQYIVLYGEKDGRVGVTLATYKVKVTPGPAKPERTADGGVIFMVNSLSVGVKRIKRLPPGFQGALNDAQHDYERAMES
jgi:hypothetical protein